MGRVLAQVEQTSVHFPSPTCLRVDDELLQAHSSERDVPHIPAECARTRARHGDRDEEDPILSVRYAGAFVSFVYFSPRMLVLTTVAGVDRPDPAHRDREGPSDPAE